MKNIKNKKTQKNNNHIVEKSNIKGFTLLELMIVMAIISIMVAVSIVSMTASKNTMSLRTSQDEVSSAIKLAQSYALQGRIPNVADMVCGYGFRFTTTTHYQIFYYTKGATCEPTDTSKYKIVEEQDLKNNVSLTSPAPGSNSRISFDIPNGNASYVSGTLELKINGAGLAKTITINGAGLLTEN